MKKIILFLTLLLSSLFFVNNTNAWTLVSSNFWSPQTYTFCNDVSKNCYFVKWTWDKFIYTHNGASIWINLKYNYMDSDAFVFMYDKYILSISNWRDWWTCYFYIYDTLNQSMLSSVIWTCWQYDPLHIATLPGSEFAFWVWTDKIIKFWNWSASVVLRSTTTLSNVKNISMDRTYISQITNYLPVKWFFIDWVLYYPYNNTIQKHVLSTNTTTDLLNWNISQKLTDFNIFQDYNSELIFSFSLFWCPSNACFYTNKYPWYSSLWNNFYNFKSSSWYSLTSEITYDNSLLQNEKNTSFHMYDLFVWWYSQYYIWADNHLYTSQTLDKFYTPSNTNTIWNTTWSSSNFTIDIPDNKCISSWSWVYRMNHNLNRFTSWQLEVTGLNQYNFTFSWFNYNINDTYTFSWYSDYELRNADWSIITNNRDTVFYDDKKYFYLNEAILWTTYEYMEIDIPDWINYIKLKWSNFEYRLYWEDNKNLWLTIKGLPMTLFSNRWYLLSKNIKKFRIEFANWYEVWWYKINNFDFQKILVDMICYDETTETYTKNWDPYTPSDDEKSDIIWSYPNEENTTDSNSYISQIFWNYYDVLLNFFSLYDVVLPSTPDLSFQFSVPHLNNHFKPYLVTETITLQPVTDNLGVASDMSNWWTAWKYFLAFMLSILYFFTRLILIGLVFLLFYIYWISVQKLVQAVFWHDFKNNPAPSNGIWLIVFISLMIVVLWIFFSIILYITPIYDFLLIVSNITTVWFSFVAVILWQYSFFQSIVNLFYAGVIATFLVYITWLITLKFWRIN